MRVRKPKPPAPPTREEIAAQIAAGLPETETQLVEVMWDVARKYDAAVIAGDTAQREAELDRFEAVVFKLNGNTFFGSNADESRPMRRMSRATAARPGAAPLWGQSGDFLVSVDGVRARVIYDGLAGLGCSGNVHFAFHVIDLHRPFPSPTGFRSHFTDSRCGMTVVERAQAEFAQLIASQGLQHLDDWHVDFVGRQRQADTAFLPGGYLADIEPLPAVPAPVKTKMSRRSNPKKVSRPAAGKTAVPRRSSLSVSWRNRYTTPPAGTDVLEDGRTIWACTVLDRAFENEIRAVYAPDFAPGSGWSSGWSAINPAPARWSGVRKAQMRRRNLRARLDKRVPLLAPRPVRPVRQPRPEGRFEQFALRLEVRSADAPATILPGRTVTERATYRARRYCELMARPFTPAPQRVRMAPAPLTHAFLADRDRPWVA